MKVNCMYLARHQLQLALSARPLGLPLFTEVLVTGQVQIQVRQQTRKCSSNKCATSARWIDVGQTAQSFLGGYISIKIEQKVHEFVGCIKTAQALTLVFREIVFVYVAPDIDVD